MCRVGKELLPFLARVPEIRAADGFAAAYDRYTSGLLRTYRRAPILNKMINEQGRFLIAALAFQLHLDRNPDDASSGLTVARLVALCAAHEVAGAGRVKALVALMRLGGFLAADPAAGNRRTRVLVPTARMRDHIRIFTVVQMRCLDLLFGGDFTRRLDDDPLFLDEFHRLAGGYFLRGSRLPDAFPDLAVFVDVDAGYMILLAALRLLPAPEGRPVAGTVDLPHAETGRRFGVSRVHVANVLDAAAARGLVSLAGSGGRAVTIETPLIDLSEGWFATQMALMHASAMGASSGEGVPERIQRTEATRSASAHESASFGGSVTRAR